MEFWSVHPRHSEASAHPFADPPTAVVSLATVGARLFEEQACRSWKCFGSGAPNLYDRSEGVPDVGRLPLRSVGVMPTRP